MQTVLLVEDDEAFRYAATRELEGAGYRVLASPGSMAALAIEERECPDILVTDVRLPPGEPHGLALGLMMRDRRPRLPILYVTGYPELVDEQDRNRTLVKPLPARRLVEAVRAELAREDLPRE
jgi:CheY-like chemotaxis protein